MDKKLNAGDAVRVDIVKSGYWVGCRGGRFVKYSKSGEKAAVKFWNADRPVYYNVNNVSKDLNA